MRAEVESLGYKHIGSLWFSNDDDSQRIRLWKGNELDIWKWSPSEDYREIVFRGKLFNLAELEFILNRCFK